MQILSISQLAERARADAPARRVPSGQAEVDPEGTVATLGHIRTANRTSSYHSPAVAGSSDYVHFSTRADTGEVLHTL